MNRINANKNKLVSKIKIALMIISLIAMMLSYQTINADNKEDKGHYTCPMHTHIEKKEAGSCPICGMNLHFVKHSKEHSHHEHHGKEKQDKE